MKSPFKPSKIVFEVIFLNYNDYKNARDAAWQILIDCGVHCLPVKITALCRQMGISIHTYQTSGEILERNRLSELASQTDGFCVNSDGKYHIFYDSRLPIPRKRFTLAHELGHIILGHIGKGQYSTRNREPSSEDMPEETQANQFAARILAPACVLHELRVFTPEQISELCGISIQAARFRAERMEVLEKRNKYYLSPLERAVRENFKAYIDQMSSSVSGS